jgi:hypothetical protein
VGCVEGSADPYLAPTIEQSLIRILQQYLQVSLLQFAQNQLSTDTLATLHFYSANTLEKVDLSLGGDMRIAVTQDLFPVLRFLERCMDLVTALRPVAIVRRPLKLDLSNMTGSLPLGATQRIKEALEDSLRDLIIVLYVTPLLSNQVIYLLSWNVPTPRVLLFPSIRVKRTQQTRTSLNIGLPELGPILSQISLT